MANTQKYVSVDQIAEQWDVSSRIVRRYCTDGRVEGAYKDGKSWKIPAGARKPRDSRVVTGRYKKPSKYQEVLLKGLMMNNTHIFLVDILNDRFMDYRSGVDENKLSGCYSSKIEELASGGTVYFKDVGQFLKDVSADNLKEQLADENRYMTQCRMIGSNGEYAWVELNFTICEREKKTPTFVMVTIEKINESMDMGKIKEYAAAFSYKLRTPISSIKGILEIEDKNGDDIELLKHLREKEMTALQELIDVIGDMAEFTGNPIKLEVEMQGNATRDIHDMKILLAEDNELNMEIAQYILEEAGASVVTMVNGKEALDCYLSAEDGEFDVILMDIQMPKLDGYEVTKRIRKSSKKDAKTVPIIAMTANVFAEDIEKAKEAGMNGYLAKPLNAKELIDTVTGM